METKKIVMGVISVAVTIIVLMSMIPIFTDAGASEDTFTNEGYFRMSKITDESATYEIDWKKSTNTLTVNDAVIDISSMPNSSTPVTLIGMENLCVRFQNGLRVQWFGPASSSSGYNSVHAELTLESGTCTGVFTAADESAVTVTNTYTDAFVIDPNGDYLMKDSAKVAYVNEDTQFYGIGITNLTTESNIGFYIVGSIADGMDITKFRGSTTLTYSNENIVSNQVSDHIDLYSLEKMTFTANDGTGDTDVTYSYFIVPYEVTAERSVHASPVEATLIGLIPLLMMVGIMLTAVGLFIAKYRKN